jgi:hypothetical protein
VEIQIIEEWGFDLGDDACLLEDDAESKVSLAVDDDDRNDPDASNQVDMLVDHIGKEVADMNCHASKQQGSATQPVDTHVLSPVRRPNTVLEPAEGSSAYSGGSLECVAETVLSAQNQDTPVVHSLRKLPEGTGPNQRKRTLSCPPASHSRLSGPWSLEWLRDHNLGGAGVIFSATKRTKQGGDADRVQHKREAGEPSKKKVGGFLRHSLFSLKRIARLPIEDRREVLRVLQKSARRRRRMGEAGRPSTTVSRASAEVATSSSSVNNDWKHWVAMQGNDTVVEEDVLEVGKVTGATFKCYTTNTFSVLSKVGAGERDAPGTTLAEQGC